MDETLPPQEPEATLEGINAPLMVEAQSEAIDPRGDAAPGRFRLSWELVREAIGPGNAEKRTDSGRKILKVGLGAAAVVVSASLLYVSSPASGGSEHTGNNAQNNPGQVSPSPHWHTDGPKGIYVPADKLGGVETLPGAPPLDLGSVPVPGGGIGLEPATNVRGNVGLDNAPYTVAENVNPANPVGAIEKAMQEEGRGEHFVQGNGTTEIAQGNGQIISPEQSLDLNQRIVQDGTTPTSP